jgi:hypothetical protein
VGLVDLRKLYMHTVFKAREVSTQWNAPEQRRLKLGQAHSNYATSPENSTSHRRTYQATAVSRSPPRMSSVELDLASPPTGLPTGIPSATLHLICLRVHAQAAGTGRGLGSLMCQAHTRWQVVRSKRGRDSSLLQALPQTLQATAYPALDRAQRCILARGKFFLRKTVNKGGKLLRRCRSASRSRQSFSKSEKVSVAGGLPPNGENRCNSSAED